MPINETILKNRKYRHCIDSTTGSKRWNRYSFWTHASDVEFNDGRNLQDKLGSFKGVTTNENQTAGYAADVTLLKSIKNSLSQSITSLTNLVNSINTRLGGLRFYEDPNGKWVVGADSVPKKLGSGGLEGVKKIIYRIDDTTYGKPIRIEKTIEKNGDWLVYPYYTHGAYTDGWVNLRPMRIDVYSAGQPNGQNQQHNHHDYFFDLKNLFPNDYQNWTKENFIFTITHYEVYFYQDSGNNIGPARPAKRSYEYDPATGILRVVGASVNSSENWGDEREDCNGNSELRVNGFELFIFN